MVFHFALKYQNWKENYGRVFKVGDNVRCRHCDFIEIDRSMIEDSRVSATFKMKCVELYQSVRPNKTVFCLGANMKECAACEHCMDHSLHPRLLEYLFEVENALLTVPRMDDNPVGKPILLQLKTTEEVKGSSSTHRKGFYNDEIYT
jgi:hypothetical protein